MCNHAPVPPDSDAHSEPEPDPQSESTTDASVGGEPPRSWLSVQLRRQVEEPTHVPAIFLAIATMWALSQPGWHVLATRICLVGWMVLGVLCAIGLVRRSRAGEPPAPLWMYMIVPVLGVLVVAAAITEAPVNVRFQLAKSDMTAEAEVYLRDFAAPLDDAIGPFAIDRVERRGNAVYYVVGNGGGDDEYGVVYRPAGPPPETGVDRFTSLEGPWYLWYANSPRRLFR